MSKVLITGGAGFLGSNLAHLLLKNGDVVTVIDNLYTGSLANLTDLTTHKNFSFIKGDVRKPFKIENGFDKIFNLACPASPIHYQKTPLETMQTSVYGAFNILEFANKNNSIVMHASTSEIYGDPIVHPQIEKYPGNVNPIGIRSCYDEGKRAAESIFFDYHRKFNTSIKILRIFNTYGPRMNPNDGRVISNFIIQALNNHDITIYGEGQQTRSFCYVTDMLDGFIKMIDSNEKITGPINIGTTFEFTILELAEIIIKLTKSKSKLTYKSLPKDDPKQRRPDISLAKNELNWSPKVALEDGLKQTIDYFRATLNL